MSADLSPFLQHSFPDDADLLVIRIQITGKCQPDIKCMEITYKLGATVCTFPLARRGKERM